MVGNPANTNCLLAIRSATTLPKENFSCLTRLDQNRAQAQVSEIILLNFPHSPPPFLPPSPLFSPFSFPTLRLQLKWVWLTTWSVTSSYGVTTPPHSIQMLLMLASRWLLALSLLMKLLKMTLGLKEISLKYCENKERGWKDREGEEREREKRRDY